MRGPWDCCQAGREEYSRWMRPQSAAWGSVSKRQGSVRRDGAAPDWDTSEGKWRGAAGAARWLMVLPPPPPDSSSPCRLSAVEVILTRLGDAPSGRSVGEMRLPDRSRLIEAQALADLSNSRVYGAGMPRGRDRFCSVWGCSADRQPETMDCEGGTRSSERALDREGARAQESRSAGVW